METNQLSSVQLIQQYHAAVIAKSATAAVAKRAPPAQRGSTTLVQQYARPRNLEFVPEINYRLPGGSFTSPRTARLSKDALRQDWGYWETKDTSDDLDV